MKASIEFKQTKINLLSDNLDYEIDFKDSVWVTDGRPAHIVLSKKMPDNKYHYFCLPFSSAEKITHRTENNAILSTFCGFRIGSTEIKGIFTAKAEITADGKINFSLSAENEGENEFKAAYYPAAFNGKNFDREKAYSVEPVRQGFIMPDTYESKYDGMDYFVKHPRDINTGEAYMPVWGRVCGKYGYSAIADKAYDAAFYASWGHDGALMDSVEWYSSLGKLAYTRNVYFNFSENCSYVTIAKDYRKFIKENGEFVSIDEKIKKNPNVKKLIGTPVIHWNLMEHNEPISEIYKQTGILEKVHNTFDGTIEKFKTFKKLGLDKAYVHTDGWGNRGYDNLHPYILPPSDKIGGFDGMRRLSEACRELGYYFGLHDQYRDYYQDSPVYDKDECVTDIDGEKPYCDYWAGGAHNWLCSKFAKKYVTKTYDELKEKDIHIDGVYLDVFSITSGDECYHPEHRITRKESFELRGECFDMLRERGIIVSSEEPGCYMVKYLDLVHHGPYAVVPQGGGPAMGIPVPLLNLVFHDCFFVPWLTEGKGGWGIPDGDSGLLHCILNAQTPYFNNSMCPGSYEKENERMKAHIVAIKEAALINKKLYNKELVKHEFLDDNYRIQKAVYSDGTEITVDFDKGTYTVK